MHGSELGRMESAKSWLAACSHLHPLILGFPDKVDFRNRRGRAYAEVAWWPESIADYRDAVSMTPDTFGARHQFAWSLIAGNGIDELNHAWHEWTEKFAESDDAGTLDAFAWTRLLWPMDDPSEATTVLKWAQRAVEKKRESWSYLESLGAALLRTGQAEPASAALLHSLKLQSKEEIISESTLWTRLHLALALHAIGDHDGARKVEEAIPDTEPKDENWENCLVWRTLYPELVRARPKTATDP